MQGEMESAVSRRPGTFRLRLEEATVEDKAEQTGCPSDGTWPTLEVKGRCSVWPRLPVRGHESHGFGPRNCPDQDPASTV